MMLLLLFSDVGKTWWATELVGKTWWAIELVGETWSPIELLLSSDEGEEMEWATKLLELKL